MPTATGYATNFITFSRASNATVTDSNGYIKWAAHNLLLASEQFGASSWTRQGLSGVTANAIAAPNGTTTADKLLETNLNDFHYVTQLNVIDDSAPVGTLSVFAKAAERQYLNLALAWGANFVAATFDLTGGTVTSDRSGGTGASQSSSITSVGGGWYLCTLRGTIGTGGSDAAIIAISDSATPTGAYPQYTGTTGNGFYVWGAHLYRSDLGGMVANTSAYPYYNPTTPKNLLGFTEAFDNAAWTKANTTVTANSTNSPNGLITADLITASAGAAQHYVQAGVTYTVNTPYSISVYAKAGTYNLIQIGLNSQNVFANFNVSTGVVGSNSGTTSTAITSVGDGWYRCSVGFTNTAGANLVISLISASTDSRIPSWTATGSETVYLWGAQLSDSASLDTYVANNFAAPTAAAYYGPRLDYDPSTLAAKGLLVEEQRTNLVTYSDNFGTGWIINRGTVTINDTASPDGTINADKILTNTASVGGTFTGKSSGVSTSSGAFCFSAFVKKGTSNGWVSMQVGDGTNYYTVWYNLNTGAVGSNSSAGTNFTAKAQNIVPYGNGWYRCWLTITRTTTTSLEVYIYTDCSANSSYQNTLNNFDYLYGAQVEAGTFPTSYIPTGASTATRTADVASVSTQAFPYSATEGTVVAVGSSYASGTATIAVLRDSLASSGYAEQMALQRLSSTNQARFEVRAGNATQASLEINGFNANTTQKLAAAYKINDFAFCMAGGTVGVDTSGNVSSGVTVLAIGTLGSSVGEYFNGHIRQITYIPRRLSNSELQARTV